VLDDNAASVNFAPGSRLDRLPSQERCGRPVQSVLDQI
jgi:hypothetical protein